MRKLHDLRSRPTSANVPSLLGPIVGGGGGGLSRGTSESSGGSGFWRTVSVGSMEAGVFGGNNGVEGRGGVWEEEEPTNTDWEEDARASVSIVRRKPKHANKIPPSSSPIKGRDPTPTGRTNHIGDTQPDPSHKTKQPQSSNDEERQLPSPPHTPPTNKCTDGPSSPRWEGREIAFHSPSSSSESIEKPTSTTPAKTNEVAPSVATMKLTFRTTSRTRITKVDVVKPDSETNSTASCSVSTTVSTRGAMSTASESVKEKEVVVTEPLTHEDTHQEEQILEDDDSANDHEVAMHNRQPNPQPDRVDLDVASPSDGTSDGVVLRTELLEFPFHEEENEDEDEFPPERQSSYCSLELIRSSSFSSSHDGDPEKVCDASVGANVSRMSHGGTNGVRKKRLSWHIKGIRHRQWRGSDREEPTRMTSPCSVDSGMVDSTMTPSGFQWQEQSMSSITVSNKSSSVISSPTSPSSSSSRTKKKSGKFWKIGRRKGKRGMSSQKGLAGSPPALMEEDELPEIQPITKSQQRIASQTHEILQQQRLCPTPSIEPSTPNTVLSTPDTHQSTPIHTTTTTTQPPQKYNHKTHPVYQNHKKKLQQSYDSILSEELYVKLADEQDFDDFIKLNKISFHGDYLLGRMIRERTRIQMKRNMLHNELEDYVTVHGGMGRSDGKSVGGNSTRTRDSEDRSVLFSI